MEKKGVSKMRRKKDIPIRVSIECHEIVQGISMMAIKAFQNPAYMQAFQEWKAAKENAGAQKAF